MGYCKICSLIYTDLDNVIEKFKDFNNEDYEYMKEHNHLKELIEHFNIIKKYIDDCKNNVIK